MLYDPDAISVGWALPTTPSQMQPPFRSRCEEEQVSPPSEVINLSIPGAPVTSLWRHVYNVDQLRKAYLSLKRNAAPGVDDQTWQQYGEELEKNLLDLSGRLKRGAYHAKPVKRAYVPKSDGSQRPIGVPVLEDKVVQRAAVEVLNNIYETDFKGFSYGFRPGRSQHNALDALTVGMTQKVNWVLDADIRGFFDAIDHEWMIKFIEHRIADQRVVRHIKKWLNAGVLEDGELTRAEEGTPKGGSVSPLLANIYLHYAFDLWADQWRRQSGRGRVIIVRSPTIWSSDSRAARIPCSSGKT